MRQLTKDEEASAQSEDLEVRREDQEKINRFSSLHQKEEILEEELRAKIVRLQVLSQVRLDLTIQYRRRRRTLKKYQAS